MYLNAVYKKSLEIVKAYFICKYYGICYISEDLRHTTGILLYFTGHQYSKNKGGIGDYTPDIMKNMKRREVKKEIILKADMNTMMRRR